MQDKIKIIGYLNILLFQYNKYTIKKVFESTTLQATNKKWLNIYVFTSIRTFFFIIY